jgi:hypothetical protein
MLSCASRACNGAQRSGRHKVRENALVAPRLRYHVTDNAPWR